MKKLFLLAAALATGMALTACGGGGGGETVVAASNATAQINATTGQQATAPILTKGFTFASGVPDLGATGTTTLVLRPRDPSNLPGNAAAANPEFTLTAQNGTAQGLLDFGSCIFTVQASTIPGLPVGTVRTIQNCSITYAVLGKEVNTTQPVSVTFNLGSVTSTPITITVTINPNGSITINGQSAGASFTVRVVSGA